MDDPFKQVVPNPKPLTPLPQPLYGMPAKSCTWQLNEVDESHATAATIYYARKPRGSMRKVNGEWIGEMSCRIRVSDTEVIEVSGYALEGYPTSKVCGNQIWYKFAKEAREKGFGFW